LVKKVLIHDRRTIEVWYGLPNARGFEHWNKNLAECSIDRHLQRRPAVSGVGRSPKGAGTAFVEFGLAEKSDAPPKILDTERGGGGYNSSNEFGEKAKIIGMSA